MTIRLSSARSVPARIALLAIATGLAACQTPAPAPPPAPSAAAAVAALPPAITRGEFLIEADKLDTWNAVGQIAVRTPGVEYRGRAQMLDLYVLAYRGEELLVLTKAMPLAATAGTAFQDRLTTKVTATTPAGKPVDSEAVAELLAQLQRELPAEIASVRSRQAAEKAAAARRKARR